MKDRVWNGLEGGSIAISDGVRGKEGESEQGGAAMNNEFQHSRWTAFHEFRDPEL